MKRFSVLVVTLLLALFVPVHVGAQASGYRSYASPSGYAFYVPSDWQPTTSIAGTEANFNSPDGNAFLFINVDRSGTSTPLSFVQNIANASPLVYQAPTKPVFASIVVAGATDSEEVDLGGTIANTGLYWGNAVVAASDSVGVFAMTVGMTSDYYNAHSSQADYIISSFQLNPPTYSESSTSSSPSATSTPIPVYTELEGSGDKTSAPFTSTSGIMQICWNAYDSSSRGNFGAQATFYVYPVGGQAHAGEVNGSSNGVPCSYVYAPPGRYYVDVVATPWTKWFVAVGPSP